MTIEVQKVGFWFWKKTIVHHPGGQTTFRGNAEVVDAPGSVCVKEDGFFSSESTCFLKGEPSTDGAELPDGKIVNRSKTIKVKTSSGEKVYKSGPFSLFSLEKNGEQIIVKRSGIFGSKIVERIPTVQVLAIAAEDCNVCKSLNPLYK